MQVRLLCENSHCGVIMCSLLPSNSIVLCDKFIYLSLPWVLHFCRDDTQSHQRYNTGGVLFVYAGVLVSSALIFPVRPIGEEWVAHHSVTLLVPVPFPQSVSSAHFASAPVSPAGLSSISKTQVLGKTWSRSVHP